MSSSTPTVTVKQLAPANSVGNVALDSFNKRFSADAQTNLKSKTIRSGAVTVVGQFAKFSLYTVSAIVLGRLLTPYDYGVVGMVTAITGFLRVVNYAGLSTATIQSKSISHQLISTVFWINIGIAAGMTLLTVALAPLLIHFYHEPHLLGVTLAMSTTFLLDAICSQHLALMRRQMRFKTLAIIEIAAMGVSVVISIAAALLGFGFWSLVLMQTVSAAVPLVAWGMEPWRPGRPIRNSGAGKLMSFGGYLTGCSILNYALRNIDNVMIGWRWGAVSLGFYQKAYSLLMLPITQVNQPIANVALSTLSRLSTDAPRQRKYFVAGYSVTAALTIPIVISTTIFAAEIIPLVLGNQWAASVRMFQYLAPAALAGSLVGPLGWCFICNGRADLQFRVMSVWTTLTITAFAAGLKFGAEGVAIAYSIISIILAFPMAWYALKHSPIQLSDVVDALKNPTIASCMAMVAGLIYKRYFMFGPLPFRAVSGNGVVFGVYFFFLLIVLKQWNPYRDLFSNLFPSIQRNNR